MASSDKPDQHQEKDGEDRGVSKRDVAEFLQAPRKKRKSYVVVACSRNVPQDLEAGIDQFVRMTFKQVAVSHPKTVDELVKQFSRQIVLLVFDDEFCDLRVGLEMIRELKRRKTQTVIPVLFMTRAPERLVTLYHDILLPYQEADEFISYVKASPAQVYSRIKAGLANKNRRRSRRYKVDAAISYYLLDQDKFFPGRLLDLSVHGGMLKSEDDRIFREGEQIKLHIPIGEYLPPVEGDFLKLSARVRRVFIGGNQAGISFEYVSEKQLLMLTRYVTEMVNVQSARKSAAMRTRAARA